MKNRSESHSGIVPRHLRGIILLLLLGLTGAYVLTQAMQTPADVRSAEKVLTASQLLSRTAPLNSWIWSLPELPLYLFSTAVLGCGNYAAAAAAAIAWLIPFCLTLLILHTRKLDDPLSLLILLALAGLPDPTLLTGLRASAGMTCCAILVLHFLTRCFEKPGGKNVILTVIFGGLLCLSIPTPTSHANTGPWQMLRALQLIFKADFSRQPLLSLTTGRYFLLTILLLLVLSALVLTVIHLLRGWQVPPLETVSAGMILLTMLVCCLPFSGGTADKAAFCAWIPFGAAILLNSIFSRSELRTSRFASHRLPLTLAAAVFFGFAAVFSIGPIHFSRLVTPSDHAAIFLAEQQLTRGASPSEDRAVLTLAAKGSIDFSADPEDVDCQFIVYNEGNLPADARQNSHQIESLWILFLP